MLMLADVQTMGVTLLSNFAAVGAGRGGAAGGPLEEGGIPEELRVSKAVAVVVRSMGLYRESAEHQDACLAALSQLLPLDPAAVLSTGVCSASTLGLHPRDRWCRNVTWQRSQAARRRDTST